MIPLLLLAVLEIAQALRIHKHFSIAELTRTVDLKLPYPKSTIQIQLSNNEGIVPIEKYYHIIHYAVADLLYYIHCEQDGKIIYPVKVEDPDLQLRYNATLYEFTLRTPISSTGQIEIVEHYYSRYQPLPKEIGIEDNQLLKFTDSVYFFTAYPVKEQVTHYDTNKVITYSLKSATQRGSLLEYGRFQDVKPYSILLTTIHLENNSPLPVFEKVVRTIEISHWGNIHIKEEYTLVNEGAKLKGEFGRVVFNKYNPQAGKHALKSFQSQLPFDCWGVYYRDEIGNISTSNAVKGKLNGENQALITLRPRFALFGGWRSNFTLGYNLPTKKYLEVDGDEYILKLPFAFSVKEIVAEEYTLTIVLPEGSQNIRWSMPTSLQHKEGVTYSYLDTVGRPSHTFTKNLTSKLENDNFRIQYNFRFWQILREPFMLFAAYAVTFASIIAIRRLNLATLKLKD